MKIYFPVGILRLLSDYDNLFLSKNKVGKRIAFLIGKKFSSVE